MMLPGRALKPRIPLRHDLAATPSPACQLTASLSALQAVPPCRGLFREGRAARRCHCCTGEVALLPPLWDGIGRCESGTLERRSRRGELLEFLTKPRPHLGRMLARSLAGTLRGERFWERGGSSGGTRGTAASPHAGEIPRETARLPTRARLEHSTSWRRAPRVGRRD